MGILQDVMDARWGVHLRPEFTPKIFAITTTQQKVLEDHPDRLSIMFINLGTEIAYAHTRPDVSSALGFYLDKNGGWLEMTWDVYGLLVGMEWWLESAGDTNVYVVPIVGSKKV